MAATLKLGNANWAAKEGSLLAYNDENDNFKPLPFDFTRASSATYVASDGLIKTSTTGQPRIDFLDNTNGTLLIEPQRTNLITYSEDFSNSYWVKNGASVTSGIVSPDGTTNSFKLVEDTSTARHETQAPSSSSGNLSTSFFAKKGENSFIQITNSEDANAYANFDLNSGVLGSSNVFTPTIIDYGNGWYRCIATINAPLAINFARIGLITSSTSARVESYTGDGTSGVYIWGAQLEAGSYPTSYIPTSGSTVTRVQDDSSRFSLQTKILGSNTGTWYFETFKYSVYPFVNVVLTAQANTTKSFLIDNINNSIRLRVWNASSSNQATISTPSLPSGVVKYLIKWNATNLKVYCNGSLVNSSSFTAYPYTTLHLREGSWSNSKLSDIKFYDTEITDAQALTLTTI